VLDKGADEHKGQEDVRIFVNLYVLGKKNICLQGLKTWKAGKEPQGPS